MSKEEEFLGFKNNPSNDYDIKLYDSEKKKKRIILIVGILTIVIVITVVIVVFATRKTSPKNTKEEEEQKTGPLVIEPADFHNYSFIFLPGFANKPEDFQNKLTKKLPLSKRNVTKIIILRSPYVEVAAFENQKNYSWFNIYNFPLNDSSCYNFKDLNISSYKLRDVIYEEAQKLGGHYDKIIIGGHSQGGCISLYTGYNFEHLLGGVIAFSGILPPQGTVLPGKENLQVFSAFGDKDDIISYGFYIKTIERIQDYPGFNKYIYINHTHFVNSKETNDAGAFMDKIMQ